MKKILVMAVLLVYAEAAYSLASAQVFYSHRLDIDKKDDIDNSAHVVKIGGYVSPLVLIPVGLGLTYSPWIKYGKAMDNAGNEGLSSTGMEISADLLGWLPMIPFITPHARISYTVWGHKTTELELATLAGDKEIKEKVSGMEIAVGAGYDVLPFVTIMAEVAQGLRKVEDKSFNATTFTVGIEAGI